MKSGAEYRQCVDICRYYFASGATRRVDFPNAVPADGDWHRMVLSVSGVAAVLQVDAMVHRVRLEGIVSDCDPTGSDCVLHLGARSDASVVAGQTAFPLETAFVKYASLCPTTLILDPPSRASPRARDLVRTATGSVATT